VYVGPLEKGDIERLRDDVKEGREVLPDKQLARRKAASKHWNR
jgi:NADH-quinone oxidoreductase subunit E